MTKKYYTYEVGEKRFTLSEPSPFFGWGIIGNRPSETKVGAIKGARDHLRSELEFHEGRTKDIRQQLASIPKSVKGIPTLVIQPAVETLLP